METGQDGGEDGNDAPPGFGPSPVIPLAPAAPIPLVPIPLAPAAAAAV
eukprot:CAMPEP_0172442998 /NCGR_PEP_ID=MMETSP1065-20121228/3316_1 /TAXON_ID=265537 /ORGANISM="Amphiprora paludosa, Strain CCMP125" /LENGTH=47 /DNA_ID= /DNA_START= /DNA_END= /DNA_ORIENTATION=